MILHCNFFVFETPSPRNDRKNFGEYPNSVVFTKHFTIALWLVVLYHKNNSSFLSFLFLVRLKSLICYDHKVLKVLKVLNNDHKEFGECHNVVVFRKYYTITLCLKVLDHKNNYKVLTFL